LSSPSPGRDPFQAQEALHRAADDLAAHGTMKILNALHRPAVAAGACDAALGTVGAATAITGKDLNTVQGRYDMTSHAAGLECLIALQLAIRCHQHVFERLQGKTDQA
jgi:hypothetical protein